MTEPNDVADPVEAVPLDTGGGAAGTVIATVDVVIIDVGKQALSVPPPPPPPPPEPDEPDEIVVPGPPGPPVPAINTHVVASARLTVHVPDAVRNWLLEPPGVDPPNV